MIRLEGYKYVSFDLFDTLIVRNVREPRDVFEIIESYYNQTNEDKISGFKSKRISAEKNARRKTTEEITIDDIYEKLKDEYPMNVLTKLKKIEKIVETEIVEVNSEVFLLFKQCMNRGQHILIVTDMYLPIEVIYMILKNTGISGYEHLFLSAVCKRKKADGSLFEYILNVLDINPKEIVHIGDSENADYNQPRKCGIDSYLYKKKKKCLFQGNPFLSGFIENHIKCESEETEIGYKLLGPILYGFNNKIGRILKDEKIDNILFLSRDGKLLKRAWDTIQHTKKIEGIYFYGSRKALIVPALSDDATLKNILTSFQFHNEISIDDILSKIGIDDSSYMTLLRKYNLDKSKIYSYDCLLKGEENIVNIFFEELEGEIMQYAKKQRELLYQYISKSNISGNVLLVDIGWNGNMQKALIKIMCEGQTNINKIYGAYIAINPLNTNYQTQKMYGFLCDERQNIEKYNMIKPFGTVLETFFMADHGTVIGYKEKNNKIEPKLGEYEFDLETQSIVKNIQDGAIRFVEDFSAYIQNHEILLKSFTAWSYFENFFMAMAYPSEKDARNIGKLPFYDSHVNHIADYCKNDSIKIKIKKLKKCKWKIGYLKQMLRLNFDYYHFYLKMIKIFRKVR